MFKIFLRINNIEMYSTYNEKNLLLLKGLLGRWKTKICKHMTVISKNIYFNVLDGIINKYNNTVHRPIKMKRIDIISDSYAE